MNSAKDYGAIPQAMHWLTVFLVALAWALGTFDDVLPKGGPRQSGLFVHVSAGIATWPSSSTPNMAVGRFASAARSNRIWRMDGKVADPVAQIAHYALYALLVAVPVAGIVLQFARGDALPLFGIAEISSPWLEDRAFAHNVKEVHEILAHALVVLAAFHAAAALIHHCIFRDRTLVRMLPHSEE